jgi:predicted deacylase
VTVERRTLTFPHELLTGLEHPLFEARGAGDGPRLTLLAGVHGCEYSSIAAAVRVMHELDTSKLSGTVTAAPIVNMQSFRQRTPFVVPVDGKNLNRCFPGDPDGSFTDVLAHAIFKTLIEPADVVVDLHGGDMVEALEPFTLYDESEVEERARDIAVSFGLPYVVREARDAGSLSGMTSTAAARAGIPAIIAEAGGCGRLEETAVRLLADGVRNVLRHLRMLPGAPEPPATPMRAVARSTWLRSKQGGWWEPVVRAGDEVREGDRLGYVRDLWGAPDQEVNAPADGVVLFLTTSPAVADDGLLLGLGTGLAPIAA